MKLKLYVGEVVNAKNGPLRNLTLANVDSVIDFLLLIRAKIMTKNDQNPFEQVVPMEMIFVYLSIAKNLSLNLTSQIM